MKESIIKDKSYAFALRIITLARWLREQKEYDLASQVLRAGTGIGANVEEAWQASAGLISSRRWQWLPRRRGKRIIGSGYCEIPRRCQRRRIDSAERTSAWNWCAS